VAGLRWRTEATADGYVTEFTPPSGAPYRVTWVVGGATSTFRLEPPGRAAIGPVPVDAAPRDAAAAERAAFFLYRAEVAADGDGGQPLTARGLVGNAAGCDDIDVTPGLVSCGRGPFAAGPHKGGCCEVHDACISTHCTGCGDSGNVVKCLAPGSDWDCSDACTACHRAVLSCFLDADDHGDATCCANGDCGRLQQCLIDDVVVTDACACSQAGVPSVDACEPCVPNGRAVDPTTPCCSGVTCGDTCCGAAGHPGTCAAKSDCGDAYDCVDGVCCVPAGQPGDAGVCLCCSGKSDASGTCL
jgi:hypothetical protein